MNTFAKAPIVVALAAAGMMSAFPSAAQVIVQGTRQIYPSNEREITVRLENVGKRASLIQAWVDDGDKQAAPEDITTPFVLRPPVFRLDGGKSQALRIQFAGAPLTQEHESIFWLNVLDIPPVPEVEDAGSTNYLQFSVRSRIKLIYRPQGLKDVASSAQKVQWRLVGAGNGWALQATNPTPYFVHLSKLALRTTGNDRISNSPAMLAPMSTATYPLEGPSSRPAGGNVQFEYINDQGGIAAQSVALTATP